MYIIQNYYSIHVYAFPPYEMPYSFAAYVDYIPINSTIIFTNGKKTGSSVCINVTIIDDDVVEHDFETFTLSLTAIEPAVTTISVPTSIVSILEKNNDCKK